MSTELKYKVMDDEVRMLSLIHILKCSRVSLITTGLSSSSALRFGMDMRPLSVSEMSHTSVRSATAPAMTTRQKTI